MHHAFLLVYMKVQLSTSVRLQPPHSAKGKQRIQSKLCNTIKTPTGRLQTLEYLWVAINDNQCSGEQETVSI